MLKIILYGSHARGGWVDEPHTAKGYVSDFDLLIIVNQKELTDRAAYWTQAEERLIYPEDRTKNRQNGRFALTRITWRLDRGIWVAATARNLRQTATAAF